MSSADPSRMEFFELDDKTSLICADALVAESVRTTLKSLGYKSHSAETSEMAIDRIRYTPYDVIVLEEVFAGSSLRANAVLSFLANLPMAQRRHSFVCLVGESLHTLDAMQAFAQSVHLVVNPRDLPNLAAILRKGLSEFDLLYKVYSDAVAAQSAR